MRFTRKRINTSVISLLGALSLLLAACTPAESTISPAQVIATQVAATMQAQATIDIAETISAQMTLQSMPTSTATATPTLAPTATLAPTQVYIAPTTPYYPPVAAATSTASKLCLQATLEQDVTYPDGSILAANETFTKTWRLKNTGTCAWTPQFDIFFADGERMSAAAVYDFPATVQPGASVDISIKMVAPATAGVYTGYWILSNQNGTRFGTGTEGKGSFYLKIEVK